MRHKSNLNVEIVNNEFLTDVIDGLNQKPKTLKPKYFYDNRGAELFTEICKTPEYYPTRTEIEILKLNAKDIASEIGDNVVLIEYGSGALEKIQILLNVLENPAGVIPVDISKDQLIEATAELQTMYPDLKIIPISADFTKPISIPKLSPVPVKRIAFFPGSTIGNFEPDLAISFLQGVTDTIGPGGLLLIGFDLKKQTETLVAAYDDKAGITEKFNKNILHRINTELGGNFNLRSFKHIARYNEKEGRVEMHLESQTNQSVSIKNTVFQFMEKETIHTENCYKFTETDFKALASKAGLSPVKAWNDNRRYFAVMLFRAS
ncbi:L-histidine N(alpha)-methyltransferase [Rhodospirillaceae bacterium]|nr:L-histidine N(alpha)-methyltransferase [Alphaproteobacteria bacterium]MDC1441468.1 L-histidine N(alpha)-methyltransferase [Rhodospirillaceae bacterium]